MSAQPVQIAVGRDAVQGDLRVPPQPHGLIVFAHGSGSSRFSPRNREVATYLGRHGFATLLVDLLTAREEAIDVRTTEYRFDIPRLASRVVAAVDWAAVQPDLRELPIGCFGASTGAAAALMAAAERPATIRAVVSRGGRPDLAGEALTRVEAPTLLVVGALDAQVIGMNRDAMRRIHAPVDLILVPGATHLFEEPGTLEEVEQAAARWFDRHLRPITSVRVA